MSKKISFILIGVLLATLFSFSLGKISSKEKIKKNVIFIISDDLRTELNVYGKAHMVTPNIDKLASEGVTFERAYVQQAVCSASRASFLTGVRPNVTGVDYPYSEYFVNEFLSNHETISSYFFNRGYYTRNFGKVHHGKDLDQLSAPYFDPKSDVKGLAKKYASKENIEKIKTGGKAARPPFEKIDVPDNAYQDGLTAEKVVETLREIKDNNQPFFLAVGFYKPHLPFNAPRKYWDLYKREDIELAKNKFLPKDAPEYATAHYSLKKYNFENSEVNKILSDSSAITLKHAYYASVSYIDTQIGKITDELERLGMRENTIVVFISDHGWHLGEQGMWGKTTNFENATRAPMIISMPNSTAKGEKTKALVEYVDIFPTLIEATGVSNVIPEYLEGTSMIQLMNSPRKKWKSAAFSQFPRGTNSEKEGYSVRTENFRYTEWWNNEEDKLMDIELYDHINDPLESINVGGEVKYKNTIKEMHEILEKGWKGALPLGFTNNSDNGYAPRSVALGKEGSNRRKQWRKYLDRMKKQGKEPILIYERY